MTARITFKCSSSAHYFDQSPARVLMTHNKSTNDNFIYCNTLIPFNKKIKKKIIQNLKNCFCNGFWGLKHGVISCACGYSTPCATRWRNCVCLECWVYGVVLRTEILFSAEIRADIQSVELKTTKDPECENTFAFSRSERLFGANRN